MKKSGILKRAALTAAIAASCLGIGGMNADAAIISTWLPATGNWSNAANWDTNPAIPSLPGDTARYAGAVAATTTLDAAQTVGTLAYDGTSDALWGITGSPLTFNEDGAGPGFATVINNNPSTGATNRLHLLNTGSYVLADDLHVTNASASTDTYGLWIHGILSGTGNVTFRNESSSLTNNFIRVSGANTFAGSSLIQKGTVAFSTSVTNFGAATNAITIGDPSGGGQGSATLYGITGLTLPNPITVASGSGGALSIGFNQNTATAHGFSGVITLNDNLNLLSADLGANNVLVSGKITGGSGLILPATNTGAVRLTSSASDFTGNTTLNSGTLVLGNNSSPAIGSPVVSGPIGTGSLILKGGTLSWNGGTTNGTAIITSIANPVVVTAATTTNLHPTVTNRYLILNGPMTGSGTIKIDSAVFSGTTTYIQGDLSNFQGTIDYNSSVANSNVLVFSSPNPTFIADGSQAKFVNNNTGGNRSIRFGGSTTLAGSIASTDAVLKIGELSGTTAAASIIGDASNSNLLEVGALGTNSSYAGFLRSAIALRKVGNGSLTLTNTTSTVATYTKGTTISGGTLIAGGNAAPNAVTPTATGGVFGTPGLLPILMNDNVAGNGTGTTNANTSLLIGGAFNVSIPIVVQNFGTGTSTIGGNTNNNSMFAGAITLDKSVSLTSVATGNNSVEITGAIGGVGGINKVGVGRAIVSGLNNYSGPTNVSVGTLLVASTNSGGGAYTVDANATLGGIGSIGSSSVTVNAGGFLSPGASIESFDVGSVTGAGTLLIEYDGDAGTPIDLLNVAGNLDVSSMILDLDNIDNLLTPLPTSGGFGTNAYIFAKYGSLTGTFANVIDLPSGYYVEYAYNDGFTSNNIAVVPEPSTFVLAGLGLVGLAMAVRRKKSI